MRSLDAQSNGLTGRVLIPAQVGVVCMLAFVGLWATVEMLAAHLLRAYSPFQVVWTRYAVHLVFMLAIWGWREPSSLWRTERLPFQLSRSMLMLAMPASWIFALQDGVPADTAASLFWISPLLIVALSAIFLRERPPIATWVATAIGWAGAIVLLDPSRPQASWPLVYPFVMAFTFALYVVMTRSLRFEGGNANLFYTAFGVFLALSPLMPFVWVTPDLHDFALLVAVGLLGYVALYALDRMAHAADVSLSAPAAFMQAVFAISFALASGHGHVGRRFALAVPVLASCAVYAWIRASTAQVGVTR